MSSWATIAAKTSKVVNDRRHRVDLFSGGQRIAVADASALIKGFSLERICDSVVTVQEVLDEVRDRKARAWLETLPYVIQTLEPAAVSVNTIIQFARKTGNLPSLSIPDIKLLAVTFELEKHIHGTEHLSFTPRKIITKRSDVSLRRKELPGWGHGLNPRDWDAIDQVNQNELNEMENKPSVASHVLPEQPLLEDPEAVNYVALSIKGNIECSTQDDGVTLADSAPNRARDDGEVEDANVNGSAEVDSVAAKDGWQQVTRKQKKKGRKKPICLNLDAVENISESRASHVSCLTGDFAMQNVLLQMGLKLVTLDGLRIKHLAVYGLKCAACFHTTKENERTFCENCGNATLYKVRIEVDENGMHVIGGLTNPRQRRGAKCLIPPPKGGKKNKDAILSEDVLQQTMQKYRNNKKTPVVDIQSPDFNEDTWYKTRAIKNEITDQLPGKFGYPKSMRKYVAPNRKR